ncbi:MAG: hypothetical protein JWP49_331, partial [Phenylobacterium sp.]|nr:hypothetical protein [Phenylobacterium sp.]
AAAVLVAVNTAVAFAAWNGLPDGAGVPINVLGLDGVRHVGVSRDLVWLMPLVSLIVTLSFAVGARFNGIAAAAKPYETTLVAVVGLLLVVEYALVGRAFDPAFDVMRPVAAATGALLMAVGNHLGKARQNAVFGLKTPWTLADAGVWDKTHRFTGRAMFAGGFVLLALGFLLRDGNALGVAIAACTAVPLVAGIAWSRHLASEA